MERIRLAGIIPMGDGFAFMHRVGVQNHPIGEYYTFPGGGQEGEETLEEGTIREIKEEFGIDVEVVRKLYFYHLFYQYNYFLFLHFHMNKLLLKIQVPLHLFQLVLKMLHKNF